MKSGTLSLIGVLGLASCGAPDGRVVETPVIRPIEVADFRALYTQNCSGCHGLDAQGGLTVGIGGPVYLAIADDSSIRRVIQDGRRGTAMAAFAQKAGGLLTDAQIEIIVHGIRAHQSAEGTAGRDQPPAYAASQPGDAVRGHNVFTANCSMCHGPNGRGARTIADASYLALVSDQHLRTVIITGMPHLGMPDWRTHAKPLSDADVTDVVAWLVEQRTPISAQLNPSGGSK